MKSAIFIDHQLFYYLIRIILLKVTYLGYIMTFTFICGGNQVICETCDQWYHAGCQNIHTLSYDQLGDSELNISWHCIICNNPNYSYTVHDYQSIEITSSLSNSNILDLPPESRQNKHNASSFINTY